MNFANSRYCKISRSLGVPLGLWPTRRTIVGKIIGVFSVIIIFLCLVMQLHNDLSGAIKEMFNSGGYLQLTVFITHEFSLYLFLEVVTMMVPMAVYILKYLTFVWNMDKVKYIFQWIQSDYDSLTNEREIRMIEKFANRGSSFSKLFLYMGPIVLIFIVYPFLLKLLNIGAPLNQSHPLKVPISVEYFVDHDRYFYWIVLHIDASVLLGASIVIFTESTFIHFITHACGLFEILGDRVDRVLESSILNDVCSKTYLSLHGQLVDTIQLHQRVLKFVHYLNTSFLPHYFVLIAIGVVSLSINLYILAKGMLLMKITDNLVTASVVVIIQFFYMGCGNYISQNLLDKGNELFTKTYYTRWHESPLPVQKMLLYIRQRCMKPIGLVFGGLYTGSLEFFASLVNTSMSYFMVLYSTA